MKTFITILIAVLVSPLGFCQQPVPLDAAKIIFNGAYIVMNKKADLVIQNTSRTALSVKNSGGIISEDADNNVIWNIGNDTNYSVPFVTKDLTAIPVSFNTSNGVGSGAFTLSTYSGEPDWQNSDYLPPGVANVNMNGKDNSKHLIDRFWKIAPNAYTKNPGLTNLIFSYRDLEWSEDSNSIKEKNLAAQNWNGTKWLAPVGTDKTSTNYVIVNAVSNYFVWWTLADAAFALSLQKDIAIQQTEYVLMNQMTTDKQSIYLSQNFPNPYKSTTAINYSLPVKYSSAKIIITDKTGNALKQMNLSNNKGTITFNAATLSSGAYQYSLYIDGRLIDTKQMIISK